MSPEEFQALPPSIQNKYFSPVERLRLGQHSCAEKRKKQHSKGIWLAPPTPGGIAQRPATSPGIRTQSLPSPEAHHTQLWVTNSNISEDQARWFVSLPEKARKQQFSREEQISLMIRCKKVLERASPELAKDVYRRCSGLARDSCSPDVAKQKPSTSAGSDDDDSKSFLDLDTISALTSETTQAKMEILTMYSRRRMSEAKLETVENASPLPQADPKVSINAKLKRKASLARRFSLTPLPLPPPTLAPPVPPVPPLPSFDSMRQFALSTRVPRNCTALSPPSSGATTTPESRPYQDKDARKQLREMLLSPEKFDEALEFGFSFSDDSACSNSATSDSFPFHQPPTPYGEYDDEDEEDGTQSVETLSPRTPTPTLTSEETHVTIKQTSFDSGVGMPLDHDCPPKTPSTRHPADSIRNREMTIHMTLTRRDLRSPEEERYSAQRQQTSGVEVEEADPLALEALSICDDPTGAHGAFSVHKGGRGEGLKRVWRMLRRS
ncbi:hypothetical protein LTR37_015552 [Vermiconidia calcicola]|uniref:Uncharacterized protein n=1 Tax=Vermiconidia calcicola TaxID=1690605 RepID=A0ACC3MR24_9PEZI|nr:hypothetical protein LTR37_015552 [Vermiconidia calcicola]